MKDVINPPSVAVALHYDKKSAPRVTAKGRGVTADQILKLAEQHQIPLQSDPQLAKLLATIPLGQEIPPELYKAVAEVIAFAYLLSGRNAFPDTNSGQTGK